MGAEPWCVAKDFEELLIWKKALQFWEAVDALLERPAFGKNYDLKNQITDAIDSVLSNIPEGFEQPTDRSFAQYLYRSKASAAEVRSRLLIAWRRRIIHRPITPHAVPLVSSLGGCWRGSSSTFADPTVGIGACGTAVAVRVESR